MCLSNKKVKIISKHGKDLTPFAKKKLIAAIDEFYQFCLKNNEQKVDRKNYNRRGEIIERLKKENHDLVIRNNWLEAALKRLGENFI